jgi:hypothetical protein
VRAVQGRRPFFNCMPALSDNLSVVVMCFIAFSVLVGLRCRSCLVSLLLLRFCVMLYPTLLSYFFAFLYCLCLLFLPRDPFFPYSLALLLVVRFARESSIATLPTTTRILFGNSQPRTTRKSTQSSKNTLPTTSALVIPKLHIFQSCEPTAVG